MAIVDRALDRLGCDPNRWRAFFESLRVIGKDQCDRAFAQLDAVAHADLSAAERSAFWEIVRDFTARHRTYHSSNWALPEELLGRFDAILSFLTPQDTVERARWLFNDWLPELPSAEDDLEARQAAVEERRTQAVADILGARGTQGIIELGISCTCPTFVAKAVIAQTEFNVANVLVSEAVVLGDTGIVLASHFSCEAEAKYGTEWRRLVRTEAVNGNRAPAVTAALMSLWPDDKATWQDAAELSEEVQNEYWRQKPIHLIRGDASDRRYQIDRLIFVGRAAEAFDRLALHGKGTPTDALLQVFDATMTQFSEAQTGKEILRSGISSHDIQQFLAELRSRPDTTREEIARREYQVLPLLGALNSRQLTLHTFMAENPAFFVEVMCEVFLPASRVKEEMPPPSPEVRARAQAAYRLLAGMHTVPGTAEDGSLDGQVLMGWIEQVRKLAGEQDRMAVADLKVGAILAHAPADPEDAAWPHRVVRDVIENLDGRDVERGLTIERYNMRGGYSKAPYEGGAQEKVLADQYREWATCSRSHWPKMARVLDAIAIHWEGDAHREDLRAEQDKLE